jgi:hypothetical protein
MLKICSVQDVISHCFMYFILDIIFNQTSEKEKLLSG